MDILFSNVFEIQLHSTSVTRLKLYNFNYQFEIYGMYVHTYMLREQVIHFV